MSKRKPPNQQSPYERRLTGVRTDRELDDVWASQLRYTSDFRRDNTMIVGGCGDPDCPWCGKGKISADPVVRERQEQKHERLEKERKRKEAKGIATRIVAIDVARDSDKTIPIDYSRYGVRVDQEWMRRAMNSMFGAVRSDLYGDRPTTRIATYDERNGAYIISDEMNEAARRTGAQIPKTGKPGTRAAEIKAREEVKKYILNVGTGVTFEDLIGNREAVDAIVEAVKLPQTHGDLFAAYGMKPPKGALLFGPPGCGKTMLAKAAASQMCGLGGEEEGAFMLSLNAAQMQSPYIGVTEELIGSIFNYGRAYRARWDRQLVVFIDEADSLLPTRDGGRHIMPWEESNIAAMLAEMDGMHESGAFVLLATNRPKAIDSALLRDGRLDRKIRVQRPTEEDAREMLRRALLKTVTAEPIAELVEVAMESLFDPTVRILRMHTDRGFDFLSLAMIVSGALVVGIVDKAKSLAFARDLKTRKASGIRREDMLGAVMRTFQDNLSLNHSYAINEYAERHGVKILEVERP